MDDDRFGTPESGPQPVDILMMVKRIATRPIDKPDIGIAECVSIVMKLGAGIEQHIGDARTGNIVRHGIFELLQRWQGNGEQALADIAQRADGIGKSAAVQSDLAEHGGKDNAHPHRLFAIIGPLQ
ncbi:hypothetical protein D3C78_731870 [compost metagenome]